MLMGLLTGMAHAGEKNAFDSALEPIADWANKIIFYSIKVDGNSLPIVLIVLGATAVFLTIYLKFINFRTVGLALRTIKGRYTKDDDPGQITHFQAICASLSATVGLGNIAGVAVAVGVGGPGATFWMIVMGLCGMTTKFVECTLGVKYRLFDKEKHTHGGPMHYLEAGFKEKGMAGFGKVLAIFFAVMCVGGAIGAGNMYQINQATSQFSGAFDLFKDSSWMFGFIVAVIVGLVIIGGIKSIARVTSFLVPFMCVTYIIAAVVILLSNTGSIPAAFGEIFSGAFNPIAVGGGFAGVLIQGIQRAAFSNEAGVGSASIAHSAVKTTKPASEGYVAMLGPFIDTVVVCTMTALVLVISGTWKIDGTAKADDVALFSKPAMEQAAVLTVPKGEEFRILETKEVGEGDAKKTFGAVWQKEGVDPLWVDMSQVDGVKGIAKTSLAFERQFEWFPVVLSIAAILFAISTMISWSFYGEQAVNYLFGIDNKVAMLGYKLMFCIFVVVGSAASLGNVLAISDAMIFAMVIPNMIGIYFLLPKVKEEIVAYNEHVKGIDAGKSDA